MHAIHQSQLSRSKFLAAGAAFAATTARSRAQGLTTIRIAGSADEAIVGSLWGVQSGIFKKYGLDVVVSRSKSGSAVSAAMIGGSLEIGKSSLLGLIVAHAKNVPFVVEAPASLYTADVRTVALVVAKESPIQTAHDFNGKTVSVPALGDLFTIGTSAWIDQNGGDSRTVKFIELPAPAAADAIAAGRVAGASLTQPILDDAIANGKCRVLADSFNAISRRFITTAYCCTAAYATQNADTLARFRKALAESTAYVEAHRPEMIPMMAKYSGVDPKVLAAMPRLSFGSVLDPQLIQPMIDTAVKYKAIPARFSARDLIDPAALPR